MLGSTRAQLTAVSLVFVSAVWGQQVGNWYKEVHPRFRTWQCTKAEGCTALDTSVVLDSKPRWLHVKGSHSSCKNNQREVDNTYCIDAENCHNNCVYEGANYTFSGVTTSDYIPVDNGNPVDPSIFTTYMGAKGTTLKIDLFRGQVELSPRVYLLDESETQYLNVVLKPGMEITADMDLSTVPCSLYAAFYMVQMDPTGGLGQYNEAGAAMGTGYCDAQCATRDFVNGIRNVNGSGSCCSELDLLEGNEIIAHLTPHTCTKKGSFACQGKECYHSMDGGLCSHFGCDTAVGGPVGLWGKGDTLDTNLPVTVITRFLSVKDINPQSTDTETLGGMRRIYVQGGKVYSSFQSSDFVITDALCTGTGQQTIGGMAVVGQSMAYGMTLAFSIFKLGTVILCSKGFTDADVQREFHASLIISNIRWGEFGSTYNDGTTVL